MKREFELLAPAGSFEILKAVIEAGADAVYVGGRAFGARAYANNFTDEELLEAIDYVHMRGKKLFLTVNTLFKNNEIDYALYDYLLPFYKRGLDAVIVQDFGVISFIKDHFPDLPIHTSTQMTITGVEGAKFLKDLGVERVVLARELSIEEMKKISTEAQVELEAFIHGALCYSYSGQCLFSSILGGRSGNRGRCAQPCRLPYAVLDGKRKEIKSESYVLSLKDLCGIEYLSKLRDAGVYSLKIEGRMKQASYAAGVVSYYRKYIDLEKQVSKEDMEHLYELGNRSGFTNTYFHQKNDKSMITFVKPSYEKSNDKLHEMIEQKYVGVKNQLPINGMLLLQKGLPMQLHVSYQDYFVSMEGPVVEEAKNKPLLCSDVENRMQKTGETDFYFHQLDISMDEDVFVPNGVLNALRRDALSDLKESILNGFRKEESDKKISSKQRVLLEQKNKVICTCETSEQFEEILKHDFVTTIYVDVQKYNRDNLIKELKEDLISANLYQKELFLRLPAIFRGHTSTMFQIMAAELRALSLTGFVVRNYEELQFVKEYFPDVAFVIDHNLYTYNDYAKNAFVDANIIRDTIPLELNQKEIKNRNNTGSEMVVYGYYPLMTTAGCVNKNTILCDKTTKLLYLKDRYQVLFPVKNYCADCYNVIYNSVPVMLFEERSRLRENGVSNFRIDFSIETQKEVENVLELWNGNGKEIKSTHGHYKRGVE